MAEVWEITGYRDKYKTLYEIAREKKKERISKILLSMVMRLGRCPTCSEIANKKNLPDYHTILRIFDVFYIRDLWKELDVLDKYISVRTGNRRK